MGVNSFDNFIYLGGFGVEVVGDRFFVPMEEAYTMLTEAGLPCLRTCIRRYAALSFFEMLTQKGFKACWRELQLYNFDFKILQIKKK